MENFKILCYYAVIACLPIFFTSCDSTERDWTNAKTLNSIMGYQKFIKKHPTGENTENAKIAVDSLKCIGILKTNNVDSLELFIKNHASSKYLIKYSSILDTIDWHIAIYSKDITKYRRYILKYPESNKIQQAKDSIWNIRWAPYKLYIAPSSIVIHSNGRRDIAGEAIAGFVVDEVTGTASMGPIPTGLTIEIWRNFTSKEKEKYSQIGLKIGRAHV